ncbi:hypothetical protein RB213_012887 [Colletotrichum asianum]
MSMPWYRASYSSPPPCRPLPTCAAFLALQISSTLRSRQAAW